MRRRIIALPLLGVALLVAVPVAASRGSAGVSPTATSVSSLPTGGGKAIVKNVPRHLAVGETYLDGLGADWVPVELKQTQTRVNAALAIRLAKQSGYFLSVSPAKAVTSTLVKYSNLVQGDIQSDGSTKLRQTSVLAWIVLIPDAEVHLYGRVTKSDAVKEPASMDAFIVVDAMTGGILGGFQTTHVQRG